MKINPKRFIFFLSLLIQLSCYSQFLNNFIEDESMLYAHTKQINQFLRRFNGEEDRYGKRLPNNNSIYRNSEYRKTFLNLLFDEQSTNIDNIIKQEFIHYCTQPEQQVFLDFHGGHWFAEVKTKFNYKGEEKDLIFFLSLQEEKIGSKWVINNIFFEPYFNQFINVDNLSEKNKKFLHPLSHELDFMNLIKIFTPNSLIEQYAQKNYKPDYFTLFIYEFRKGSFKFITIQDVKFHFFQLEGWYFELSKFNRNSYNSGWLISNLLKITKTDQEVLKNLIFQK